MARIRKFIDTDVLTEARARIRHIYECFDTVAVMFSGGKDSLAALHLTKEVRDEFGDDRPINVVFRDEELIQDEVIDFVDGYRQRPWVKMLWFTVPLLSHKFILGQTKSYTQWDPGRPWVRGKPPWGISLAPGDDRVFDQYTMDGFTGEFFTGKTAFITGIRAAESIMRFRASVNKLNDNYINATTAANVSLCKPLFDWQENDVFKYFHDNEIAYCSLYDHQLWTGGNLRVSTPLHAESAKRFDLLRACSPEFYDRVVAVFPEMLAHERYYGDLDRDGIRERYGQSLDGVLSWINENITDEDELRLALKRFKSVAVRAKWSPDSYPPRHILNAFMSGGFKREIMGNGLAVPS
jgi:predicted phosphoadenosine phosphosulfate sulfurtransferase